MTSRDGGSPAVAGGPARHVPVLCPAAIGFLELRDGGVYIDGTFGAGGYTRAMLDAANCKVIAIDRDQTAIAAGFGLVAHYGGRLELVQDRFSALDEVARASGHDGIDGVVLDLGVSSMQLDRAERGFSFRQDGPLDMRMGREGPSAADVVAQLTDRELATIISVLGEERHARAVARAIVREREKARIDTTLKLAEIVARVVHVRPGTIHPATRTFQALRIFVNEELAEVAEGLAAAERILKPGGRLSVVSFHSLEDRIVKNFMVGESRVSVSRHAPEIVRAAPSFRVLTKKPVTADDAEIADNPRARSAKLRAAERTDAPARKTLADGLLPHLPDLASVKAGG